MASARAIRVVTQADLTSAASRSLKRVATYAKKKGTKMTPSPQTTPTAPKLVKRKFFNLDNFESVSVVKPLALPEINSTEQALAYLGNSQEKLNEVIRKGIVAIVRSAAKKSPEGWTLPDLKTSWNGPAIDEKKVKGTINVLAQTVYGLSPDMTKEEKAKRRELARNMIKSNADILNGMKENCLVADSDDDDDDDAGDDE